MSAEPSPIPWDVIAGGGAAVAVIVAVVLVLRWAGDTIKTLGSEFSETMRDANEKNQQNVETFSETATTLVKEARDAHVKCEETIHAILKEHLPKPP